MSPEVLLRLKPLELWSLFLSSSLTTLLPYYLTTLYISITYPMDLPQTPQVRVPETESIQESNATATNVANHNSTEVEMGGTQDTSQPDEPAQDSTLPDVQAELELPAPAKKSAGFNFLE